ncbi:MAG TPA: right-handed parallel beta-helix repeat-containing protein [Solirubrobacteraceae bacterium]|nr:right-handed parallel beta-helix repeat-containing protein [Solirubrobacteraceae bacterium]
MRVSIIAATTVVVALSSTGVAGAATGYPPPKNPLVQSAAPKGPFHTLKVCAKGCAYKSIQQAVNAAKAGDTIKVAPGTYRERVIVKGPSKRYLKIIGDPKNPGKVVLSGKKSTPRTVPNNGISVNGADNVTVNGLSAFDYNGYGFFAVNVNDYLFTNLVAKRDGVYGIYAFNSVGGTISNSTAAWNNDSGFYIGQTPVQTKPKRSYITNVVSYGNQLGYSGTNMRYVTITKSKWFNNGIGLVPNALDSEKYAPPEKNVISDNDIFWNNFNYYAGTPWKLAATSTGTNFPVGIGVLLFGGRDNRVENNRVWGNYLGGVGGLQQALLKQVDAQELQGNIVRGNDYSNGGKNPNGRDLFYDGDGKNNCFDPTGTQNNEPQDNRTLVACGEQGYTGPNFYSGVGFAGGKSDLNALLTGNPEFGTIAGWALSIDKKNPASAEAAWVKPAQAPIPGYTMMEHWTPSMGAN